MTNNYPFYYEVRFKLFAFDKDNNVRNESFIRTFKDLSPLQNRDNAFEEIEDYISALESLGRLTKDKKGNYKIAQPSFINKKIQDAEQIEDYFESLNEIEQFQESISIYLVVTDLELAKDLLDPYSSAFEEWYKKFGIDYQIESEFEIHKIASNSIDEQKIIDNLEDEVKLYVHFHINVEAFINDVYHYGVDYGESGEDEEGGAKRTILHTPYIWNSIDDYNEVINSFKNNSDKEENSSDIDFKKVIERGENNQIEFKPSLLYNFNTGKAGITPKFHIAKTICAFMNSNGGVLFIGVTDTGNIQGLEEYDYSLFQTENKKDKIRLELDSLLAYFFGVSIAPLINSSIEKIEGKDVLIIQVRESYKPVFVKNKKEDLLVKEMYVRMNASTRLLSDNEELADYIFNKDWKKHNEEY